MTGALLHLYTKYMAQSFVVFDFGTNEDAAQQARVTLERWKQSFRLDKKLMLKFERPAPPEESGKVTRKKPARSH